MGHVPLVSHKTFVAIATPEWKISGVSSCMPNEFVSIPESFMTVFAGIPLVVALVNPEMFRQMLALRERLGADVAAVRPDAGFRLSGFHEDRLTGIEGDGGDHGPVL
jgi:hypothetical protein